MKEENLNSIYKFCYLLNHEFIKEILNNYLNDYEFKDAFKLLDGYICSFNNKYGYNLILTINKDLIKIVELKPNLAQEIIITGKQSNNNNSIIKKNTNSENESITMYNDITIKTRKIEKRTKGIIFTNIYKTYSLISETKEYIVSEIREKQYIITKERLENSLGNFYFDKINARDILSRIKVYERHNNIERLSDYNTFIIINNDTSKGINLLRNQNKRTIKIILNDKNISNIYSSIEGNDKIPRIYDLYNGIISPESEKDIDNIRNGLLSSKCFNLKSLKGINSKIDNLTGESLDVSYKYLNYLKRLFNNKYNYSCDINLTRDELLKIILDKPKKSSKNPVLIKKLS